MKNKHKLFIIPAAAALAFPIFAGVSFINSAAATYDEPVHLSSGYSYWVTGHYMMNIMDHPPLAEMLSALPVLALKPANFTSHPYFANAMPYRYGDLFLYQNSVPPARLLNYARLFTFLLWGALTACFLYLMAAALSGPAAAAIAVAVFAFMPVFISNNALVSTDAGAAVFFLGAMAAACRCSREPASPPAGGRKGAGRASRRRWAWAAAAGALAGLAMVSKFSMFIVPPMIIGLWFLDAWLKDELKPGRLAGFSFIFLAAAALVVVFVYRFEPGLYFKGLAATLTRLDQGRSSFAWGNYSLGGVWWYFPFAFAVKTPLAAVFLAGFGAWYAVKKPGRDWLWVLLPPALYFAASFGSKVQIGYRHILPVMPFLALAAGLGAGNIIEKRKYLPGALALLLVFSWGWLLHRTHPYYLAYFNELAGGPANGYKLLADSNLDWGQDVKTLGDWLKKRGDAPVILSYFGVARPESSGINYTSLCPYTHAELKGTGVSACSMKEVLLAVSATNLQGVYYPDKETFAWLKTRKPVFVAGYSIFVYDLTSDKEGLEKLAAVFDREGRNPEADCLYARAR